MALISSSISPLSRGYLDIYIHINIYIYLCIYIYIYNIRPLKLPLMALNSSSISPLSDDDNDFYLNKLQQKVLQNLFST
jgi:hypothetical protein